MAASQTLRAQYKAEVHAADGVRFVARAEAPDDLSAQLVGYIGERFNDVLWPSDAREVRALIDGGMPRAAISRYFECVGKRWDHEWLEAGADFDLDAGDLAR